MSDGCPAGADGFDLQLALLVDERYPFLLHSRQVQHDDEGITCLIDIRSRNTATVVPFSPDFC